MVERVLIEREVARVLAGMGIREERLSPSTRLLQDLRIDGDDAVEFFEAVGARFGTDLTVLREDWKTHFGPEGLSIVPVGRFVASAVCVGLPALLAGLPFLLCAALAAAGGAAGAWLTGGSGGATASRPVRLGDVVRAIERGRWQRTGGEDR